MATMKTRSVLMVIVACLCRLSMALLESCQINDDGDDPRPGLTESSSGVLNNRADRQLPGPSQAAFRDALTKMAHASIQFTWDSYQALNTPRGENVFYSPYSIMNALGMLTLASSGATASELEQALRTHWSMPRDTIHVGICQENAKLRSDNESTFGVANRFFVDCNVAAFIDSDYVAELRRLYGATMEQTAFVTDPTQARRQINDFVSESTFGEIHDFLAGNPDPLTRIMLVNAIYFKALWTVPFRPQFTTAMNFQTRTGNVILDFMYQRGLLPYTFSSDLRCQMLALMYTSSKKYGMYIVLPLEGVSLEDVEKNLSGEQLLRLQNSLKPTSVEVRMPRFSLENRLSLRQMLVNLGAAGVFDPKTSDYSHMFSHNWRGMPVDDVLHEAKLKVDEEGTVASAATAIIVTRTGAIYKSINVNRPFLFLIADQSNGFVLFWGRVENPTRL